MLLTLDGSTLTLNDQGFITSWSNGKISTKLPAYIVFFKDYSRLDPTCRLWDTSSPIDNMSIRSTELSYTKKVESIEISCTISIHPNGWDWRMEILGEYPLSHRMGIATPIGQGRLSSLGTSVDTPVAQYYRSSQEVFPDQTFLHLPILYCESQRCLFSDTENDAQLFSYQDGDEQFVRVTVSTSVSQSSQISFRSCEEDKVPEEFISKYPGSERYIYTWKPKLEQISKQQSIEISYYMEHGHLETPFGKFDVEPPTDAHLKQYTTLLAAALDHYPPNFLKSIGIDGIMLAGKITSETKDIVHSTRYSGLAFSKYNKAMRWIICDASLKQSWLVHHEIFHYLQDELDLGEYPIGGMTWLTALTDDPLEQQCDLFASIMTSQRTWSINDLRYKQARVMEQALHSFDSRFLFGSKKSDALSSETKIWYVPHDGEAEQIDFGNMPDRIDGVFVFDLNWYNELN